MSEKQMCFFADILKEVTPEQNLKDLEEIWPDKIREEHKHISGKFSEKNDIEYLRDVSFRCKQMPIIDFHKKPVLKEDFFGTEIILPAGFSRL